MYLYTQRYPLLGIGCCHIWGGTNSLSLIRTLCRYLPSIQKKRRKGRKGGREEGKKRKEDMGDPGYINSFSSIHPFNFSPLPVVNPSFKEVCMKLKF